MPARVGRDPSGAFGEERLMHESAVRVLAVNTGSSSLKAAAYLMGQAAETLELVGTVERIGEAGSRIHIGAGNGATLHEREGDLPTHEAAVEAFAGWLREQGGRFEPAAIGHRVVHGGPRFQEPQLVTAALTAALQQLVPVDPDHLPQAIAAITAMTAAFPDVPQVACFDTAFHRTMPAVAQAYALPLALRDKGIRRYGFHGLSYEYILGRLRELDPDAARGRLIIAHLGNGASMVAVRDGRPIETTMGFSPTGGLVMGTRVGDLDPTVLLYLLEQEGYTPATLSDLVNRKSGLLAVSGTSADMRDLLARRANDARAAEAIGLFCYQARKFAGALAATLGGLDTLVFTGGIGEHAAPVRAEICAGLGFLGVRLDAERNAANASIVSDGAGSVTVRVIPTNEDLVIARHAVRMLRPRVA